MSSLRITSHCTQTDVIIENYITLHTKWSHHWAVHLTAHKLMSSLSSTSHCTQTAVIEHYITIHIKRCSHCALHHTAHKMMAPLRITSHCTKKMSRWITSHCTQNDVVTDHYITLLTEEEKKSPLALSISHVHVALTLHQPCTRRFNIASAMHTSF